MDGKERPSRYRGIHFRDVDMEKIEDFTNRLRDDQAFERFRSDPIGQLREIGVDVDPESEIGRRLIRSVGEKTAQFSDICLIVRSDGDCIIVPVGQPEDE